MEIKHTPGPWVFDVESGDYPSWVEGADRATVIAGCGCCGSPNLGIEDARLICAAPELLEALELMVSTHEEGGWPTATITIAKAAIAKAKGEEQ